MCNIDSCFSSPIKLMNNPDSVFDEIEIKGFNKVEWRSQYESPYRFHVSFVIVSNQFKLLCIHFEAYNTIAAYSTLSALFTPALNGVNFRPAAE